MFHTINQSKFSALCIININYYRQPINNYSKCMQLFCISDPPPSLEKGEGRGGGGWGGESVLWLLPVLTVRMAPGSRFLSRRRGRRPAGRISGHQPGSPPPHPAAPAPSSIIFRCIATTLLLLYFCLPTKKCFNYRYTGIEKKGFL